MRDDDVFDEETDEPEQHRGRRQRLLRAHPEIKRLFGTDARTAWVTLAVWIAQLGVAAIASAWMPALPCTSARVVVIVAASYFVGAILSHWLGMTIHETSHDLVFRARWANRWLALFANLPMIVPIAMTFHRYHLDHHRLLGVRGEDTDLPSACEVKLVGRGRLRKLLWLAPYAIVYALRGLTFAHRPNRWEIYNGAQQIVVSVVLYALLGPWGFAYLALSTFFGHSLHPVAAHFIHEHYLFAPGQETYSYYGPLNLVTFNVGYHVEHHDFMNVPGSRLPELRAIAHEAYDPLVSHESWTLVLFHFVVSPMSVGSRRVRDRKPDTPRALAPTFSR